MWGRAHYHIIVLFWAHFLSYALFFRISCYHFSLWCSPVSSPLPQPLSLSTVCQIVFFCSTNQTAHDLKTDFVFMFPDQVSELTIHWLKSSFQLFLFVNYFFGTLCLCPAVFSFLFCIILVNVFVQAEIFEFVFSPSSQVYLLLAHMYALCLGFIFFYLCLMSLRSLWSSLYTSVSRIILSFTWLSYHTGGSLLRTAGLHYSSPPATFSALPSHHQYFICIFSALDNTLLLGS